MAYYGSIEIMDTGGWSRTFALEKNRVMVGSAPFNDLVLSEERGGGIAPTHLQLFYTPGETSSLRVVNLVNRPLTVRAPNSHVDRTIAASGSGWLQNGDRLEVGDFQLKITLSAQGGIIQSTRSEHLGVTLELPGHELRPDSSLAGRLTLVNFGEQSRCQFEITLEGLPDECFKLDPAPLLYPGGKEQLQIRFFHRGILPPAGPVNITLRACAPNAYPTELVIIDETLFVMPVFCFDLTIAETRPPKPAAAPAPIPAPTAAPVPVPSAPQRQPVISQAQPTAPAVQPVVPLAKPVAAELPTSAPQPAATVSPAFSMPPEPFPPSAPLPAPPTLTAPAAENFAPAVSAVEPLSVPDPASAPEPESLPPAPAAQNYISVISEGGAASDSGAQIQDWFSAPSSPAAHTANIAPGSRLGAPKKPNLRAGQNIPIFKAQSPEEEDALLAAPPIEENLPGDLEQSDAALEDNL